MGSADNCAVGSSSCKHRHFFCGCNSSAHKKEPEPQSLHSHLQMGSTGIGGMKTSGSPYLQIQLRLQLNDPPATSYKAFLD